MEFVNTQKALKLANELCCIKKEEALRFANELGLEIYFDSEEHGVKIKGKKGWISLKEFFPELQLLLSEKYDD